MTEDRQRIADLLYGHLKDGSADEQEARRALACKLRSARPLDLGLRFLLADLIDPDRDEVDRCIRFGSRRSGRPSDALAEKQVAEFIFSKVQTGEPVKVVIDDAVRKFGLKRARLLKIWGHWKPILKRLQRTKPLMGLSDWHD
ncbi:MAG TPA: hypothetical protein VI137_04330 [Pseudolabrys sp.]|jgi:hypothetical protein